VQIPTDSEEQPVSSQWVSDAFAPESSEEPNRSLEDTQQIHIQPPHPQEILEQSRKMIEEGNIPFALRYIQDLAADDNNLEGIRDMLEGACQNCPQESNLWLALGNIYQRLNQKEKALEVFTRAQKFISL
jgi:Tfp pilus assembly protein PilF